MQPDPTIRIHGNPRRAVPRGVIAALALVLVSVLTACQPSVWPVTIPNLTAADRAGDWIASDYQANGAGYTAGGLADIVLSLAAVDGHRPVAVDALGALEAVTPAYVQPGGSVNPGGTAKVMLAVQAMGQDPNGFAGLDLEALLRGTLVTSGVDTGRLGTSSAFTQSLGIMALKRTSAKVPPSTVTWLLAQQCPDGGFSSGACTWESPDATGLAINALLAVATPNTHDAVQQARDYLVSMQLADGGFGASNTDTVSNASSTGLAAQALRQTQDNAEAEAAATFIRSLQYGPGAGVKAGAIPWRAATDGSLLMSTTQAVLAFGSGTYVELSFPEVIGEACQGETGVTEIVDLTRFDNTIRVACAQGPQESGWAVLENAGFDVASVPGFEGAAVCQIESFPAAGYPTCWQQGFWSYWLWSDVTSSWGMSDKGASNRVPDLGTVEGWRYEPDMANHWALPPGIPAPAH